jgi:hypothetical protein
MCRIIKRLVPFGLLLVLLAANHISATASTCQSGTGPVASDDTAILFEPNTLVTINPLRLAHDPNGCALSIVSVTKPQLGMATIFPTGTDASDIPDPQSGSGLILYQHNKVFTPGIDRFNYTIKNSRGQTATARITVLVYQSLQPPVAADYTVNTIVGGGGILNVVEKSRDPDGQATGLPIRIVDIQGQDMNAVGIYLTRYHGDSLYYNALKPGITHFNYVLYSDATGLSSLGRVTINSRMPAPPVAPDYVVSAHPGQQVEINVLSKASDPDAANYNGDFWYYNRAIDKYIWLLGIDMKRTPPMLGKAIVSDHSIFFTPNWDAKGSVIIYYRIQGNFFHWQDNMLGPISTGKVTIHIEG